MRPSYSDIVSKSPPTKPRNLSPNISGKVDATAPQKVTKTAPKSSKITNGKKSGAAASGLKRQHSGDEPAGQKSGPEARPSSPMPMLIHRRVSVEEGSIGGDEDEDRSVQDSSSQSGDSSAKADSFKPSRSSRNDCRNFEGGVPLNNHKASKPGMARRPLHINNNLNLPSRFNEKNVVKGGKPCKNCGEERRGNT
jgi:hypothetical protein